MADTGADTIVILSSELIAKITEQYFNKTMFKQSVEIVDLKPTENGYMFSIAFTAHKSKTPALEPKDTAKWDEGLPAIHTAHRDKNGKFVKVSAVLTE